MRRSVMAELASCRSPGVMSNFSASIMSARMLKHLRAVSQTFDQSILRSIHEHQQVDHDCAKNKYNAYFLQI